MTLSRPVFWLVVALVLPRISGCAVAAGDLGAMAATAAGVPQMEAFLPHRTAVPAGPSTPIDGVYTISTIAKKIRIEGGRAYAVEGWLHAFTLRVRPEMVVARNIVRAGPGQYSGEDLPLLGQATYQMQPGGAFSVVVATMTGPARFSLIPVSVDDPGRYGQEMDALGLAAVPIPRTPATYLADRYSGYPGGPGTPALDTADPVGGQNPLEQEDYTDE